MRTSKVLGLLLVLGNVSLAVHADTTKVAPHSVATPSTSKLTTELPSGYESYESRPDILSLTPKADSTLGGDWQNLKRGHLEAVALLLEMYPDREIYFLARDSELLYDLARFEARKNPALQSRLHLLNISRANMRAEHVKDYLAQEGISEATLRAGKKVLFVDTGFSGTIPRVLSEYFPADLHAQLQTHLMSSNTPTHPSTRVFLTASNPAAPTLEPGSMHGSIISYEHMPRFTDRSDRFARTGAEGRWEPVSRRGTATDGSVSKDKARAYMQDLLAYATEPKNQELLEHRRAQWRKLRALAQSSSTTHAQLVGELKGMLDRAAEGPSSEAPFVEALVRDFVDMRASTLRGASWGERPDVKLEELGLAAVVRAKSGSSNKLAMIEKYPEWAPILEDPVHEIRNLVIFGDWGKLGAILDAVKDAEIDRIVCNTLGDQPFSFQLKNFVKMLIEKGDTEMLRALAYSTFPKHGASMREELRSLIEKGDRATLIALSGDLFSKPYAADLIDEFKLLVDKGDSLVMKRLAVSAFHDSHVSKMRAQLRYLIEKGDQDVYQQLATSAFTNPSTSKMNDELKLMVEKSNATTLQVVAGSTFSSSHTGEMKDALKLLIERAHPAAYPVLAFRVFSQPHSYGMEDLVRLLIEKGDSATLQTLASRTFSQPHTEKWKDALKLLIEKSDDKTQIELIKNVFSRPYTAGSKDLLRYFVERIDTKDASAISYAIEMIPHELVTPPEKRALTRALTISDLTERRKFLNERFGPSSLTDSHAAGAAHGVAQCIHGALE